MVDSRAKGARNEIVARDKLRKYTNLQWERVPASGALSAVHGLKGDLYVPKINLRYCVEVKGYKDDHLNSSILTSKSSQFHKWWEQACTQAAKVDKEPLLIFKKDNGKLFIAFKSDPLYISNWIFIHNEDCYVALLEEWCTAEKISWEF